MRMPIKLWEPVEKSSCIPEGGDIRSPMKQNATGGATGDEHMARWSRYDRSAKGLSRCCCTQFFLFRYANPKWPFGFA